MADFTSEQKRFVVRCWAYRMDSREIISEFKEAFPEAELPKSAQIARYNPHFKAGITLSAELQTIYDEARDIADTDLDDIDGAHQTWRLRELTKLHRMAVKQGALVVAKDILKQLAQERGGMFTQKVPGASPGEVYEFLRDKLQSVKDHVVRHVSNPGERDAILAAIEDEEELETGS